MNINKLKLEQLKLRFQEVDLEKIQKKFANLHDSIKLLEKIQEHSYADKNIALTSIIHRSALVHWPQNKQGIVSNEILEFLGDSYLNIYITLETMLNFPEMNEGELSKLRAAIVGTENLACKSILTGIGNVLLFGKGEIAREGKNQTNILADAFEAATAALLLDGGEEKVNAWLKQVFQNDIQNAYDLLKNFDAKTQFQQYVQSLVGVPPTYKLIGTECTLRETLFIVGGFIGGVEVARAKGINKREASKTVAQIMQNMVENGELTEQKIKEFVKFANNKENS